MEEKKPLLVEKILNEGYIELWDVMGNDASITDAARTSYSDATKRTKDRNLIRYMYAHKHTSPFEMVEFKFKLKMPIFIARQWIRHRTASLNELSGRYSELPEEFYDYSGQGIPLQSTTNNQGSEETKLQSESYYTDILLEHNKKSFEIYHELLLNDASKEIARCHLPLSTYTSFVWKIDLHNLLHFLNLRMDSHAQYEIRVYAEKMFEIIKQYVPLACEAFEDYQLNAMSLSSMEIKAIFSIVNNQNPDLSNMSKREVLLFNDKLKLLGYNYHYE